MLISPENEILTLSLININMTNTIIVTTFLFNLCFGKLSKYKLLKD